MEKLLLKKEDVFKGNLILVNRKYQIKENTKEEKLSSFSDKYSNMMLDNNANLELQKVLKEIKAENKIVPVSGYRSLTEQENIWYDSLKENGEEFTKKYVAYPNCSEHQTGLAIDLGLNSKNIDFIRPAFPHTGICEEFRQAMIKYGFIQRYKEDKEKITEISNEEWHFRYVGYPHAKIMQKMNYCLEEYIDYIKVFKLGRACLAFENYEISYLEMDEDLKEINIRDDELVTISGNNINGIIITKRRKIDEN